MHASRNHPDPVAHPATRTLAVFPVYRDNPYSNAMLLAPRAAGWTVLESAKLDQLEADLRRLGDGDVFHMHWTAPIVQRADTGDEARERLDRFRRVVTAASGAGAHVVWTIHNVLPHDARHVGLEIELNRFLASVSDAVHVLNGSTAEAVREFYELDPAKVHHIPHPSYQGVYDGSVTRSEARREFDLEESRLAVLFFGQMRPYKGVDTLIEAMRRVAPQRATALLLAGRTSQSDKEAIDSLLPEGMHTVREHDYVADQDVERWFRAADVVVLPYRKVLNSGSLYLAATFGKPVVLPDEPHLRGEFGDEPWIRWFVSGDPGSLAETLRQPLPASSLALDFSRRHPPYDISRRYAALLEEVRLGNDHASRR